MHMGFDTAVAAVVGLNGAVMLDNLAYWIKTNEANERNFHDGYYWTYNTTKAYEKLFPFWTARMIRYTLSKLEHDGYILIREYNKDKMNHTKWYTITEAGWRLFPRRKKPPTSPQEGADDVTKAADKAGVVEFAKNENRNNETDFPTIYTNSNDTGSNPDTRAGAREGEEAPKAPRKPSPSPKGKHVACPFQNPTPELSAAWQGFEEMRRTIRKPLTQRAADLIGKSVQKFAPGDMEKQAAILDQSVAGSWQSVYPLKVNAAREEHYRDASTSSVQDLYDEGMAALARMEKGEFV